MKSKLYLYIAYDAGARSYIGHETFKDYYKDPISIVLLSNLYPIQNPL